MDSFLQPGNYPTQKRAKCELISYTILVAQEWAETEKGSINITRAATAVVVGILSKRLVTVSTSESSVAEGNIVKWSMQTEKKESRWSIVQFAIYPTEPCINSSFSWICRRKDCEFVKHFDFLQPESAFIFNNLPAFDDSEIRLL